jgi:hypothetical protein
MCQTKELLFCCSNRVKPQHTKFLYCIKPRSVGCNFLQSFFYRNMTKNLLARLTFALLAITCSSQCFGQSDWDVIKEAKTLPMASNKATVKGFSFAKNLHISKDSLNNGFDIVLEDPSYKIVFFRLYYEAEDSDIWVKTIYGNKVTVKDAPILNRLKKGEILGCTLFKLEKAGKYYTLPEFNVIVAD